MSQPTSPRLLFWSGFATCWVAGLPVWAELGRDPGLLTSPRYLVWMAAFFTFLALFSWQIRDREGDREESLRWSQAGMVAQSLAALVALAAVPRNSLAAVLLVIVAARAPAVLPRRAAVALLAGQTVAMVGFLIRPYGIENALIVGGAFAGFQLFAFYTFEIAESESRARAELARAHESLLATRQLLAESTRSAERLRIARELHDVLGHHLTALSLNLEAARHAPEPQARERVETAQRLARDLLQEVRQVVSVLRQEDAVPLERRLASALAALGAGIEEPAVHLAVQPEAEPEIHDPELEHALVRFAQEAFTNAVRHAGARNLWLEVAREGEEIAVRARDDGRGAAGAVAGHGLNGMRERIERLGGRLAVESAGKGFEVAAWIPLARSGR